jgi:hypothetical protein
LAGQGGGLGFEKLQLLSGLRDPLCEVAAVESQGVGVEIIRHHPRLHLPHGTPKLAQIVRADSLESTQAEESIDIPRAEPGHAEEQLALGAIDVHRKAMPVPQRPCELGIDF